MRFFNTAGPCDPARHYTLPPEPRLPGARELVNQGQYFVVHAPRQTGKTTTLTALARDITAEGRQAAVLFSCERARIYTDNDHAGAAGRAILQGIGRRRIDLLVTRPYTDSGGKPALQREVIELKVRRPREASPIKDALGQLDEYLSRLDLDSGTLIIFDRRPGATRKRPDPEFSRHRTHRTPEGRAVTLLTV